MDNQISKTEITLNQTSTVLMADRDNFVEQILNNGTEIVSNYSVATAKSGEAASGIFSFSAVFC